jgi:hypothetical protein
MRRRALGETYGAEVLQDLERRPQVHARIDAAPRAAEVLAVREMDASAVEAVRSLVGGRDRGLEVGDRLVREQRAAVARDRERPVGMYRGAEGLDLVGPCRGEVMAVGANGRLDPIDCGQPRDEAGVDLLEVLQCGRGAVGEDSAGPACDVTNERGSDTFRRIAVQRVELSGRAFDVAAERRQQREPAAGKQRECGLARSRREVERLGSTGGEGSPVAGGELGEASPG